MSQYNADEAFRAPTGAVTDFLRVLMALVGIVLMGVALFFVIKALNAISTVMANPQPLADTLTQWSDVLGFPDGGVIQIEGQPVPTGKVVAAIMLGVGTLVFAQISLSFLSTGAKLLMLAAQRKA